MEFRETDPAPRHAKLVHRYVHLRTRRDLDDGYRFHALPDACTYVIFDQCDLEITGVTRLELTSEEMSLGNRFSYVNIRFFPGVWTGPASYGVVDAPYAGELPLIDLNARLRAASAESQAPLLDEFVDALIERGLVAANPVVERLLAHIESVRSVAEMASVACLSPRQLQRTLRATTGFAPSDFLKVMRLQRSLLGDFASAYSDQSHFIRSFRTATGYTPGVFSNKYDV